MVEGVGIDIVEIERVSRSIAKDAFCRRVFTDLEREYCEGARRGERYAGRFAAKEAIFKALGRSFAWQEVEIRRSAGGAPQPLLTGLAAERLGERRLLLTISHSRLYAIAHAVIEGGGG